MADLTDDQKHFLIVRLACFTSPSKLRPDFKDRFGIDVSFRQISYYSPLTAQGSTELPDKWKSLFWETRERYKREVADIPIAEKWYRLLRLQEIIDDPDMSKSSKTVLNALKQAAQEEGGQLEGKGARDSSGESKPLPPMDLSKLNSAELDTLEALVSKAAIVDGDTGGTGTA